MSKILCTHDSAFKPSVTNNILPQRRDVIFITGAPSTEIWLKEFAEQMERVRQDKLCLHTVKVPWEALKIKTK